MQHRPKQLSVTAGTGLSSAGAALLVIFFFSPWLTACGLTFSGKDLAVGIDVGLGVRTGAAYPGLILFPLVGLVAFALCLSCINQPPEVIKRRSLYTAFAGAVALIALIVVGIGFASEMERARSAIAPFDLGLDALGFEPLDLESITTGSIGLEYGYFGSVVAAALVLVGALLNRQLSVPSNGQSVLRSRGVGSPPPRAVPPSAYKPSKPTASVSIQSGPLAGRTIPIYSDSFTIGRSSACDLAVPDQAVSRQHARLVFARGAWFVQDQGSKHGIILNGHRVRAARLNSGDRIQIGNTTLIFRC